MDPAPVTAIPAATPILTVPPGTLMYTPPSANMPPTDDGVDEISRISRPEHVMMGAPAPEPVVFRSPTSQVPATRQDPEVVARDVPLARVVPHAQPQTFLAQIPAGTPPGSQLIVTVPPGYFMEGRDLLHVVPENLPADGVISIPIISENFV